MNTLEVIANRKSIRNFNTQPVEKEKLEAIAKAAVSAPAGMAKPVYVTVVTNKDALSTINQATKKAMISTGNEQLVKIGNNPEWMPLYNAPVALLVSAPTVTDAQGTSNNISNCAVAAENAVIAATDLGLASCYVTSPTVGFMVPGTKAVCGVAEDQTVNAIVLLGYSDDKEPSTKHINAANIKFVD